MAAEFPPALAARMLPPEAKKKGGAAVAAPPAPDGLPDAERAVLELLSTDEPAHIDALAEASRLAIPELTGVLLSLEMRELVRQLPGRCFVRKIRTGGEK